MKRTVRKQTEQRYLQGIRARVADAAGPWPYKRLMFLQEKVRSKMKQKVFKHHVCFFPRIIKLIETRFAGISIVLDIDELSSQRVLSSGPNLVSVIGTVLLK